MNQPDMRNDIPIPLHPAPSDPTKLDAMVKKLRSTLDSLNAQDNILAKLLNKADGLGFPVPVDDDTALPSGSLNQLDLFLSELVDTAQSIDGKIQNLQKLI